MAGATMWWQLQLNRRQLSVPLNSVCAMWRGQCKNSDFAVQAVSDRQWRRSRHILHQPEMTFGYEALSRPSTAPGAGFVWNLTLHMTYPCKPCTLGSITD
jgi:hypothetical protein